MIVRVAEQARASGARRVVATDDARILDAVIARGFDRVMTCASHATGTDRLPEAAANSRTTDRRNVQGDEPLLDRR